MHFNLKTLWLKKRQDGKQVCMGGQYWSVF